MRKHGVIDQKLIPIFVSLVLNKVVMCSSTDEVVLTTILKIFVCYSLPAKREDNCYRDMRTGLLHFADSVVKSVNVFYFHDL